MNRPGLSVAAAVVIAELSGRTGYLPAILRLRRVEGAAGTRFEVVEIVNLAEVRERARLWRWR